MSASTEMSVSAIATPSAAVRRFKIKARSTSWSAEGVLNVSVGVVLFLGAHVPIGLLLHASSIAGAVHAAAVFILGMYLALFDRRLERVACVGAYIIGAEVLWHMTQAPILWEFGKYSVAMIFFTAIVANRLVKFPPLPIFYFILLLPSVGITLLNEDWTSRVEDWQSGRDMISFNMSGPLALMVCCWFFSNVKLSTPQLQRLFLAMLGPIIAISTIAVFGLATTEDLDFGTTSNATASGGFGPNQVSAVLGLGALLAFLFFILSNRANQKTAPIAGIVSWLRRFLMICLMIVFIVQSALTFSRGGLYNTVAGLGIAFLYLIRESRSRLQFIFIAIFLLGFSAYVLLPKLNEFTGGTFAARFESTNTTGREDFMEYQLGVFSRHILFGNGPGRGFWGASHTEYTRLLADHGLLGVIALVVLIIMALLGLRRARSIMKKAVVASVLVWSFVFMAHLGMRLAAPSFMIGLTFSTLLIQKSRATNELRKRRLAFQNALRASMPEPVPVAHGTIIDLEPREQVLPARTLD